jgi:hypothetical protein
MLHPTVVVRARGGVGTASRERRTRRRRAGRQGQPRSADGGRRVLLPCMDSGDRWSPLGAHVLVLRLLRCRPVVPPCRGYA